MLCGEHVQSFMQELLQLCDEEGLALQGFRAQASDALFVRFKGSQD